MRRGQALIETAIFLPVFLLILFGVIWVVQTSVINERLQLAVRYSGLISNAASPYSAWSLYSLYENSEYGSTTVATRTCYDPTSGILTDSSPLPGPSSAPFWQPATTSNASCTPKVVTQAGGTIPSVFNNMVSTLSATTTVPSYLQTLAAPNLTAEQKFFGAPDMKTMLSCYVDLQNAVEASFLGTGGSSTVAPPLLSSTPTATSVTVQCPP